MDSGYVICEAETKYLNRGSMIYLTNILSPRHYSIALACGRWIGKQSDRKWQTTMLRY